MNLFRSCEFLDRALVLVAIILLGTFLAAAVKNNDCGDLGVLNIKKP